MDQVRQLKHLRDENTRLKQLVAELMPDKTMLQDVLRKSCKPSPRRPFVKYLEQSYRVSERHTCCVPTQNYEGYQQQWIELCTRILKIARIRVRYGYQIIRQLLKPEDCQVGKDLIYQLYREEELELLKRPAEKRCSAVHRRKRLRPTGPN